MNLMTEITLQHLVMERKALRAMLHCFVLRKRIIMTEFRSDT